MNALILAAGLGTRLGTLTAHCPKALVEVNGHTMLEHQLRHLSAAGFDRFVINIHHFADEIREYLEENSYFGLDIILSDESCLLLDTGGGIRRAMNLFKDDAPVLVHNVDIFSDVDLNRLYHTHLKSGADATLLTARRLTSRYLYFNEEGALCGWSNEKTGEVRSPLNDFDKSKFTPYAFQGIHVISGSVLPILNAVPEQRFSITDFYVSNAGQLNLLMVESNPSGWVDAGKPEALERAAQIVESHYEHTA
ncbi:MAG: nucleotidyltransferase family protein [Bacteroidaceae bacterium]|nr:nucleotidyltransferase family protein [Bacteroidaceae bacterium]